MAKMKPGQITAKRAYEISDSLAKESQSSYRVAQMYKSAASKGEKILDMGPSALNKAAEYQINSANYNTSKGYSLRNKADAAVAKANAAAGRDTPLPSSEGLFSKIKNWFD